MKKLCIVYANCQNELIANYLTKSDEFNREYFIKTIPIHRLIRKQTTIPNRILKQAQLFIYQPVKNVHGDRSTEYLLGKLSADCQHISFPPLYFTGCFPQFCRNPNKRAIESLYPYGIIPQGDANIISMLEQNIGIDKIINHLNSDSFYQRQYLENNVNKGLRELARRESNLSIKISDFIRDNYQKYRLFYAHNHPTDNMGIYVVNQILKLVNFPELDDKLIPNPQRGVLDKIQIPLYPSVVKHLELDFAQSITFYKHKSFCTNRLTLNNYIRKYADIHLAADDSATGSYLRGIEQTKQNELLLAEQSFQEAIAIDDNNPVYYRELATVYEKQGQLDLAKQSLQQAIAIAPDWVEFYQSLADILIAKENLTGATLLYKRAIELEPENKELYSLLGDTFVKLDRLDLAEKCYLRAIKLDFKQADEHRCLGNIYRRQNSLDKAVVHYQEAIEIAPQNPWLYIHLSEILIEQNKLDEANKNCKQSLNCKKFKKVGIYRRIGDLQVKIGSFDDAISTYRRAIKLNPTLPKPAVRQIRSQIRQAADARDCNSVS